MKYKVVISEQAASDLRAIFDYIAYELMAGQTALKQLERIEEAVLSLGEMPERNRLYKKEPWRSKNLRVMSERVSRRFGGEIVLVKVRFYGL